MNKLKISDFTLIGHIGVDSGLCWVGDPCYVFHKGKNFPKELGTNWEDFCKKLSNKYPLTQSFNCDLGHSGLGIVTSTGMGDGCYPVYAIISDEGEWGKRVGGVFIDFLGLLEDEFNSVMEDDEDDEEVA